MREDNRRSRVVKNGFMGLFCMRKRIFAAGMLIVLVLSLCACSLPEQVSEWIFSEPERLTDDRSVYEILQEGVLDSQEQIPFLSAHSEQEVTETYRSLLDDHPEYFWVADSYTIHVYDDGSVASFCPDYVVAPEEIPQIQTQIDAQVSALVSEASALPDEFEKALFLHDYLVQTVEYDSEASDHITQQQQTEQAADASSIYGVFINQKAVCSGYAKAYQYLLTQVGIESVYVLGQGISEQGTEEHIWNIVYLEGNPYHIDVTWDDPVFEDGESDDYVYHDYFGLTTEQILRDHTITDGQDLPICEAEACNYFVRKGLYLESYQFETVRQIIETAVAQQSEVAEVCFTTQAEQQKAITQLIEEGRLFDIPVIDDLFPEGMFYTTAETPFRITFYLTD